jgi:hypothetical protein
LQHAAQPPVQQAAQVVADAQHLLSHALADDAAYAVVASSPATSAAASRVIFFICVFFLVED